MKNNKGFTLMELVVVLGILGIISLIALPRFLTVIAEAKISADQATVNSLNNITSLYRITSSSNDPFEDDSKSDDELMQFLSDSGYLSSMVTPQTEGASFEWIFDGENEYADEDETWYLMFEDSFHVVTSEDVTFDAIMNQGNKSILGIWSGGVIYTGSSKDIVIPTSLTFESVERTIKHIGQDSFNNTGLIAVKFEETSQIVKIHARAFKNNNLSSIDFPDTVTEIDYGAFMDNDLSEITVGANLTHIQGMAFGAYTDSFKSAYGDFDGNLGNADSDGGAGTYILNEDNEWVKKD